MSEATSLTSNPKSPDEWSLEDARKYAAEARERGHNPEDQCNSGWLVRLDAEIERLTRRVAELQQFHDWAEPQIHDHGRDVLTIERLTRERDDAARLYGTKEALDALRDRKTLESERAAWEKRAMEAEADWRRLRVALDNLVGAVGALSDPEDQLSCIPAGPEAEELWQAWKDGEAALSEAAHGDGCRPPHQPATSQLSEKESP